MDQEHLTPALHLGPDLGIGLAQVLRVLGQELVGQVARLLHDARRLVVPPRFALFVTCATTLLAFATLAFSSNAVLHAIGLTVSVGAVAAFLASAALARQ